MSDLEKFTLAYRAMIDAFNAFHVRPIVHIPHGEQLVANIDRLHAERYQK